MASVFFLFAIAVWAQASVEVDQPREIRSEEQVILALLVASAASDGVVLDSTCNKAVAPEELPGTVRNGALWRYTKDLRRLYELNRPERRLPSFPEISATYVAHEELQAIFRQGGWELYRERYPAAPEVMTLSYPYLDAAGKKAIVYVTRSSGLTSASSFLLILRKRNGGWRLTRTIQLMVS